MLVFNYWPFIPLLNYHELKVFISHTSSNFCFRPPTITLVVYVVETVLDNLLNGML